MKCVFNKIQDELIHYINSSESSLKIAVTWFTNHEIFNAIQKKIKDENYKLELIVLNDKINNKNKGINFQKIIDSKNDFYYSECESMVHHKFCLIDDQILITGSYNWTYYAENRNWENIVIISDKDIINEYITEFERLKSAHSKITDIAENKKTDILYEYSDYIQDDYRLQAEKEISNGNILEAGRIFNEILKLNSSNIVALQQRKTVIDTFNHTNFEICPFEIGIKYKSGYQIAIPSFTQLPCAVIKEGRTPVDNATTLKITFQKYDYKYVTIGEFLLTDLKPMPLSTLKLKITLTLDKTGILTIVIMELNGFGRHKTVQINLNKFI